MFDYDLEIDNICELINEKKFEEAERRLSDIYGYKPVHLSAVYAKALLLYSKNKKPTEVFKFLEGKVLINSGEYSGKYVPILDLLEKINLDRNDRFNSKKFRRLKELCQGSIDVYNRIEKLCSIEDKDFPTIVDIYKEVYASMDFAGTIICREYIKSKYPNEIIPFLENIENVCNMKMFVEKIHSNACWVIMCDSERSAYLEFIEECLAEIGNSIETVAFENNISEQLMQIYEKNKDAKKIWLLGMGRDFDALLYNDKAFSSGIFKMTARQSETEFRNIETAMFGSYVDYISEIYEEDCEKLIALPSDKKFSIVIPARNSSYTLRDTLNTCLSQLNNIDFEIVLSDNSTNDNQSIFSLWKEINDSRIKYLRTPRELSLPKSFEYAILHARGEYVLPIGSDDGLLPWTLKVLNDVIEKYPDEYIIQWERGFYAWPGFNGTQQNQFVIPKKYADYDTEIYFKNNMDYLAEAIMNPKAIYELPMLYINSCFRRDYLHVLLEKTGRLWDGICQDVYMGVVNCLINSKILNVKYPLSIAGMSNASIGANSIKGITNDDEYFRYASQSRKDGVAGGYVRSVYEQLVPQTGTDTFSLYTTFMRAVSIGILDEIYIDKVIPWQDWYTNLAAELDVNDISFEKKMELMRQSASMLGDEFYEWFSNGIYKIRMAHKKLDNKDREEQKDRSYIIGKNEQGGITVDASEYDVHNIYDAAKLFAKLIQEGY